MIHDAIRTVLLWSKSLVEVLLVGMDVLGILMVRTMETLNAQKTNPKRNRTKEWKEIMKDLGSGASSRRKHDGG